MVIYKVVAYWMWSLTSYILGTERLGEGGLMAMSQLKIMPIVSCFKRLSIYISIPFHRLKLAVLAIHSTWKKSVIMIYMSQNVKTLHHTVSSLRNPCYGGLVIIHELGLGDKGKMRINLG